MELSEILGVDSSTLPYCLSEQWNAGAPALSSKDTRKCIIVLAMAFRDRGITKDAAIDALSEWSHNKTLVKSEVKKAYASEEQLTCAELGNIETVRKHCERDYCDYPKWRKDFNLVQLENLKKNIPEDDSEKKDSAATKLAKLARKNCLELWHTPDGDAYITLFLNGHREYKRLSSKSASVKAWLSRLSSDFLLETPSQNAIISVITLLQGKAIYDGQEYELHVRKAELDGKIYVDLGDPSWRAIEISTEGWQIIEDCPVRFRRPKSLLPLPLPELGGDVQDLKKLVNATTDEAWIKYTAWLSQAFWCRGPYVHLFVRGPQGCAKSALAENSKALIDPSRAPKRHLPDAPRDLMMACHNEAVPSFDNVSDFEDEIADTICIISTGGSSAARELYTDADEALIYAKNPIIMNGIADPSQRGDLLDRLMILDLEAIPEENRIAEKVMAARLVELGPKLLGVLLDATVTGLLNIDNIDLKNAPRMADFATWAVACSPAFGWEPDQFMSFYKEARTTAEHDLAETNRLMMALYRLAIDSVPKGWKGTSTELLSALSQREHVLAGYEPEDWPKKAQNVGTEVRRLVIPAASMGVEVKFSRYAGKNLIEVRKSEQCRLNGEGTHGYTEKTDSNVTCVTCVSFLKERSLIQYKAVTQKTNKEEISSAKPTQPTQVSRDAFLGVGPGQKPTHSSLHNPDHHYAPDGRDLDEDGQWEDCEACNLPLPPSWQNNYAGGIYCPRCFENLFGGDKNVR